MNPSELPRSVAGAAKHPEDFAIEGEFVNSPWITIGHIKKLAGPWGNANRPRGAVQHGLVQGCWSFSRGRYVGRLVSHPRANLVVERHIDADLTEKLAVSVEYLNAPIPAVSDIHIVCIVCGNAVRRVELTGAGSWFSPGFDPVSAFIDLGNARIDIAVTDIRVPC